MSGKTILDLVYRLNEIMVEMDKLEIRSMELEDEYNQIVYELWGKIPSLKNDENIQPKKRVKEYGFMGKKSE